ncbi:MAG: sulfatase [Deltaproteobacteria bacterium]|nr:sulfatase [Deltaproteobacteria bacterium]
MRVPSTWVVLPILLVLLDLGCRRERAAEAPVPVPVPEETRIDLLDRFPEAEVEGGGDSTVVDFALLADEVRDAVVVRPPATIRFRGVPLHPHAVLSFGVGADRPAGGTAPPVSFVVRIDAGDGPKEVFRRDEVVRGGGKGGWSDVEIPLTEASPVAAAEIVLEATGGDLAVVAGWAWPEVVSDGAPASGDRSEIAREEPVRDLLASFADARTSAAPGGETPRLLEGHNDAGRPYPPALVVPAGASVRWEVEAGPSEALRVRFHASRESRSAVAAGTIGFSVRARRSGGGAPGESWKELERESLDVATLPSGMGRMRSVGRTLTLGEGRWEVELEGVEAPGARGAHAAFGAVEVVRRTTTVRRTALRPGSGRALRPLGKLGAGGAAGPRNIVLLLADTLRDDHLGSHGYERDTAPALARWEREGVVLEDVSTPAPSTLPATACLLTGTSPPRNRVFAEASRRLPLGARTLAEVAQDAGYTTAAFIANPLLAPGSGFEQGFEEYEDLAFMDAGRLDRLVEPWIRRHRSERFLLYVHAIDPHAPYVAPGVDYSFFDPEYAGLVDHDTWSVHRPWFRALLVAAGRGMPFEVVEEGVGEGVEWTARGLRVGRPLLRRLETLYDGEIRFWDRQLDRVLATLREEGLWDETVVAVVADHGEGFGETGHYGHGFDIDERILRVPVVFLGAGVGEPRRVSRPASLIDVAPTLLDLAGLAAPEGMEGMPLRELEAPGAEERPILSCTLSQSSLSPGRPISYQTAVAARTAALEVVHFAGDRTWRVRRRDGGPARFVEEGAVPVELKAAILEFEAGLPRSGTSAAPQDAGLATSGREVNALRALGYLH